MKPEQLFHAIDQCEDRFIEETASDIEKRTPPAFRKIFFTAGQQISGMRVAAAILIAAITLSFGIKTAAEVSTVFREWIEKTFQIGDISQIAQSPDRQTSAKTDTQNTLITLKDDMQLIALDNESFIYEYTTKYDAEGYPTDTVKKVYGIEENHLKNLPMKTCAGAWEDYSFSFGYSVIGNEIYAYNYKADGDVFEVLGLLDKNTACGWLEESSGGKTHAVCIRIDLKTGKAETLFKSNTWGSDERMSPDGRFILVNHAKEYWTAFDTKTGTEEKVKGLAGYALSNEYYFVDDTHIVTDGDPYEEKSDGEICEMPTLNYIDLTTMEIKNYRDYGDIKLYWTYTQKGTTLTLKNILNSDSFSINNVTEKNVQPAVTYGDYSIFYGDENKDGSVPCYIINLKEKAYMRLTVPKEIAGTTDISIASKENKLLLINEKEAYLVDLSNMKN